MPVPNIWRVCGDSAKCHLFLSKPWDVPPEPDAVQAACKLLPVTSAALSISCISETGGKLNGNVGTRLRGTGRKAICPEGPPRVGAGMSGSGCINTRIV